MRILLLAVLLSMPVLAQDDQDKVKYCKNYRTGEIIVVEIGYPCPYPTAAF